MIKKISQILTISTLSIVPTLGVMDKASCVECAVLYSECMANTTWQGNEHQLCKTFGIDAPKGGWGIPGVKCAEAIQKYRNEHNGDNKEVGCLAGCISLKEDRKACDRECK